eukprot:5891208-Prymnesium_polylepis.1
MADGGARGRCRAIRGPAVPLARDTWVPISCQRHRRARVASVTAPGRILGHRHVPRARGTAGRA